MTLDLHWNYLDRVLNCKNLRVYYDSERGFKIGHDTGYITIGSEQNVFIPTHGVQDRKFKYELDTSSATLDEIISYLKGNLHLEVMLSYSNDEYFQLCTAYEYVYPPHISKLVDKIFSKANMNEAMKRSADTKTY